MTLDLTCQACDTSFELDVAELLDEPRLQCPGCDARVPRATAEALSGALEELFGHVARLRPKFQLIAEVESDDLPPPFDRERPGRAAGEAGEDDDEGAGDDDEELEEDEPERDVDDE
ncbi:hypothetical protein [Anaeromyxobacter diazotrophicus]|uniref:Uncharacterized protein n=1 Tax=Anaeromyxobacter diazotrophicus TaxID=2590199 RepID=A0A7I9VLM5_9BACT|nr:hypothetical protein [Anaeromyxobacter diazotrophicus]GEJ57312.1 hypothetical protein AMYX_20530 [Anaeromyxobacter diazotrophicus]